MSLTDRGRILKINENFEAKIKKYGPKLNNQIYL